MKLLKATNKDGYHKRLYLTYNDDYIKHQVHTYIKTNDNWSTVFIQTFYNGKPTPQIIFGKEALRSLMEFV